MKIIWVFLCALVCVSVLVACNEETPADTTADTVMQEATENEGTIAETEAAETVADTETQAPLDTDMDTMAETQVETLPVEKPEPTDPLTEVSFNDVAQKVGEDIDQFFTRNNQATIAWADDATEGKVLALSTKGVSANNSSDPYVHLQYSEMAGALGYLGVDTLAKPYLVLKVKDTGNLWSHMFAVYAYNGTRLTGTGLVGEQKTRMKDSEEWQYIYFDLSSATKTMDTLRLDFVNAANAAGETLYISEIKFVATKEEAMALCGENTYKIKEDRSKLNIMSFNVQTENGSSVRFDIRADMLRDLIDEYQPDSIGMQEVTPTWRNYMETYVFNGSYTGVGEARTTNAALGLEQSCIFYRSDKYDLLDSGTFWLSATPDVVGSIYEGSQYPRICTYVHLKDKVTGQEFIHMNTHLDHTSGSEGRSLRLKQETVMLQKLATLPAVPTVITGDFNQRAHNTEGEAYAVYKLMTGERSFELPDGTKMTMNLADSRYHAPDNMPEGFTATMTTYHDESSSKYDPDREPIDYAFYTPDKLTALSYQIRLYSRDGVYLSDHLPVITSFEFVTENVDG